ncbi:MAG: hypothetical protein JXA67_12380 [Micromonosporaceae bacterium]|nr:hypothetical protein [Micromonosporaceae bacterium]
MSTSPDQNDKIIEDYLSSVESELIGVPVSQRAELLDDLRGHIASERGTGDEGDEETEAQVRGILERLGDPVTIAAAARADAGQPVIQAGTGRRPLHRDYRVWALACVGVLVVVLLFFTVFGVTITA